MADSSQTHTKKVQKKQRQKKQHIPNIQYSTIGRRILATDHTPFILNIYNIKKKSLDEIQNKKQKDIKQFFVSRTTNKITNTNNNKRKEVSNNIETTKFNLRHISKINGKKPVGPNTTKENTKEKIKTSTDTG